MSPSDDPELPTPSTVDKGKRRAQDPTERTPLLQDSAYGTSSRAVPYATPPTSRHRLRSMLTTVFLASLSLCVIIAVFIAALAWSYASKASGLSPDKVLNEDVVLSGPFGVDVLNTTDDGGLWLRVSGRMGFDAGGAIGVNPDFSEDEGMFEKLWKAIGRWSIRKLDAVTVDLACVHIAPEYDASLVLVSAVLPPLQVPLAVDPPRRSLEWLSPVTTELLVKPTRNVTALATFMTESWQHGTFAITADVKEATVRGGAGSSWKSMFHGMLKNIQVSVRIKIPSLPGLPLPGRHAPFPPISDLLTLKTFRVSNQHNLTLHAETSIINPLPKDVHLTLPSLPFTVSLPGSTGSHVAIANIATHPCEFTHPNITLHVSGTVPALPKSSSPLLSEFLSRYLNAQPNPILISTPLLSDPSNPSAPRIEIHAEFPAPTERPQLLRDVTIKDMKIRPSGTSFLASGVVFAKVVLPKGLDVGVNVFLVFPDVLVFDGEVPEYSEDYGSWKAQKRPLPPMPDYPNPLPERAFGHIRPDDWLPSTSVRLESKQDEDGDGERKTGAVYAVSAKVADVPLEVLPGRQREFSNFIGKVIFGSGGAVAGIQGYVAVALEVDGLPVGVGNHRGGSEGGTLELTGLPFRGSVRVGKRVW